MSIVVLNSLEAINNLFEGRALIYSDRFAAYHFSTTISAESVLCRPKSIMLNELCGHFIFITDRPRTKYYLLAWVGTNLSFFCPTGTFGARSGVLSIENFNLMPFLVITPSRSR